MPILNKNFIIGGSIVFNENVEVIAFSKENGQYQIQLACEKKQWSVSIRTKYCLKFFSFSFAPGDLLDNETLWFWYIGFLSLKMRTLY